MSDLLERKAVERQGKISRAISVVYATLPNPIGREGERFLFDLTTGLFDSTQDNAGSNQTGQTDGRRFADEVIVPFLKEMSPGENQLEFKYLASQLNLEIMGIIAVGPMRRLLVQDLSS